MLFHQSLHIALSSAPAGRSPKTIDAAVDFRRLKNEPRRLHSETIFLQKIHSFVFVQP